MQNLITTIEVFKIESDWHIRDYGRGLQYSHFTQNENIEKLESPYLIGKFGVGLKDALAVFYRKGIHVEIESKYAHITLKMVNKSGFDVQTLHALFDKPNDVNMVGTDFIIKGIGDNAINKAKSMFLCFNKKIKLLETTKYGQVYSCNNSIPTIYINGVQVAFEENFLFSYNITNINAQIKKALNRERTNVGRVAYSDTVKNILRQCKSDRVLLTLVADLKNVMSGINKDEAGWVDVATYAAKTLNRNGDVTFMTPAQRAELSNQQIEILKESGKMLIMVTDNVYSKIAGIVNTFDNVYQEYNDSFQYNFVNYRDLTQAEKKVFDLKEAIIKFCKKYEYQYDVQIKISETIKVDEYGVETQGICDYETDSIIIKRSALKSEHMFISVLIHELTHYQHGYPDNSRDFENDLTEILGYAILDNISSTTKSIFNFWKR